MAQSGYTPIQLYRTTTAGAAPSAVNLSNGELALNYNAADMALYAKNGSGSVIRLINNPAGLKYPTADGTANQFVTTDGAGNLSWDTAVGTIAIASSNGFAGTSSGGHSPTLTLSTTVTGILKGNGTAISAAVSGTDYAPATSGNSILYGNGSGGFSNVTIGSGVSFAGGVLSATGTGGTITGSGTANYVSKFSSSTALTNSVIYDDGTNVGIGTSSVFYSAANRTSVNLNGTTSAIYALGIGGTAAGYLYADSTGVAIGSPASKIIAFDINGEKMRIDSSGNVGIGTTATSSAKLNVSGSSQGIARFIGNTTAHGSSDVLISRSGTASSNVGQAPSLQFENSTDGSQAIIQQYSGNLQFWNYTTGVGGWAERMRIDSSGNVGIGTSSPAMSAGYSGLHVNSSSAGAAIRVTNPTTGSSNADGITLANDVSNAYLWNHENTPLVFATNNTQRMTIDASGNVGIGTTGPTYQLQLSTDSAAKPSTNTWTIASDERIKNVTGEYTKGLAAVCALRPVTYEYNGKAGFAVDGKENISIIAQEAMAHFPECVGTFDAKLNEDDEDKTTLYNWNGHALTFALVNAIKEQQAIINDLKSRIEQLEAKA